MTPINPNRSRRRSRSCVTGIGYCVYEISSFVRARWSYFGDVRSISGVLWDADAGDPVLVLHVVADVGSFQNAQGIGRCWKLFVAWDLGFGLS